MRLYRLNSYRKGFCLTKISVLLSILNKENTEKEPSCDNAILLVVLGEPESPRKGYACIIAKTFRRHSHQICTFSPPWGLPQFHNYAFYPSFLNYYTYDVSFKINSKFREYIGLLVLNFKFYYLIFVVTRAFLSAWWSSLQKYCHLSNPKMYLIQLGILVCS